MRKDIAVTRMSLLLVFMVFVYAPSVTSSQIDKGTSTKGTSAVSAKLNWEDEWNRTLLAAKNEGSVVVYTGYGAAWRRALADAMLRKYGITLNLLTAKSSEIAERVMTEQRTKTYSADVVIVGSSQYQLIFKPAGVLQSLEKVLILPEVKDPNAWWSHELPWLDADTKTYFQFNNYISPPLVINNDLVKLEEVKSYKDLLNPKWRGKIVLNDPTVGGGSGQRLLTLLAYAIMDWDYVRDLVKQEPILVRDNRQMAEWVARGKYPMALGSEKETVSKFIQSGAPLKYVVPAEGTYMTPGYGFVSHPNGAPHPNAARVFINFLLSKEGQTLSSKTIGLQSNRLDVAVDELDPIMVRQPGVKYLSITDKGFMQKEVELKRKVVELFKPLLR